MRRRARREHPRPESHAVEVGAEVEVGAGPTGELERLIFLSDGVFAIAMTLLAVELALPEVTSESTADLGQRLISLGPRYFSYALSFLVIASYWRSHQKTFRYIVRLDSRFVWLNLTLLLCIAFLPFPTSVLGSNSNDPAAITLYAGTLAATGLVLLAMWLYAATGRRLISPTLSPSLIHHYITRAVAAPLVFLVSIAVAQVDTSTAKYLWLSVALVMWAVGRFYRDSV
jgi:uncharacterized membrane protein